MMVSIHNENHLLATLVAEALYEELSICTDAVWVGQS